jgi:hypothetical protein
MKAKNLVYWGGLLVLLLGTVWASAGAGSATQTPTVAADKVASIWPAGIERARICIDLTCPDGTPRDEFCRCPTCTSIECRSVPAADAAPATPVVDKLAGFWPIGIDAPPRPCPDVMCPDGSLPDEYCRCRPRACIDLMCPDGSPRDKFCRCPTCTSSECAPVLSTDTPPAQPGGHQM